MKSHRKYWQRSKLIAKNPVNQLLKFAYFLYHTKQAVQAGSQIWQLPLPISRQPLEDESDIAPSHGDYFCAARDFLQQSDFKLILAALSQYQQRHVALDEIQEIRVILAKHGEFYHPARIETVLPEAVVPLVLNVAVSDAGKNCIQRECRLLNKLNTEFPFAFLPKVYGQGRAFTKSAGLETRMFLGEWFEGFNEFHLSRDPTDNKLKIVVWDSEHGSFFLTTDQASALYRQAAKILTCYYHPATFEQIDSWHHAAGDFVVKCEDREIDVKLIAVRQYRPMLAGDGGIEPQDPDPRMILEALLVFFLKIALRMRLDRLDGVGEIVWADRIALGPTLQGFSEALGLKPPIGLLAEPLVDLVRHYLLACSRLELFDLNSALVQKLYPRTTEVALIKKHLESHVNDLYDAIQQHCDDP